MAAKIVLFFLYTVVAASLQEGPNKAVTAASRSIVKAQCQNGGTNKGVKCICPEGYNPLCKTMGDEITIGKCQNGGTFFYQEPLCEAVHDGTMEESHQEAIGKNAVAASKSFNTVLDYLISGFCNNGGTYNGTKCICPHSFVGPRCEFIDDDENIIMPTFLEFLTVDATLNQKFTEALRNEESEEYKNFTRDFKNEMRLFYSPIREYNGVRISSIGNTSGNIYAYHYVIVEIKYQTGLYDDYLTVFHKLSKHLSSANCTGKPWCPEWLMVGTGYYPTEEEVCRSALPEGLKKFYDPIITKEGLRCVPHCDPMSPNYLSCNGGLCQIERGTGPHCLCPDTDSYMYLHGHCTGKTSKPLVFASFGATIGVLFVLLVVLGIFFWRKNKGKRGGNI